MDEFNLPHPLAQRRKNTSAAYEEAVRLAANDTLSLPLFEQIAYEANENKDRLLGTKRRGDGYAYLTSFE